MGARSLPRGLGRTPDSAASRAAAPRRPRATRPRRRGTPEGRAKYQRCSPPPPPSRAARGLRRPHAPHPFLPGALGPLDAPVAGSDLATLPRNSVPDWRGEDDLRKRSLWCRRFYTTDRMNVEAGTSIQLNRVLALRVRERLEHAARRGTQRSCRQLVRVHDVSAPLPHDALPTPDRRTARTSRWGCLTSTGRWWRRRCWSTRRGRR